MRYSNYISENWLENQLDMLCMAIEKCKDNQITDEAFDITFEQVYDAIDARMQPHVQGRRITCLSLAQAREIMEEIIGRDETPPPSQCGWALRESCSCGHTLRNKVRTQLRTKLDKRFKELGGDNE